MLDALNKAGSDRKARSPDSSSFLWHPLGCPTLFHAVVTLRSVRRQDSHFTGNASHASLREGWLTCWSPEPAGLARISGKKISVA